jgi:hypothetical protein
METIVDFFLALIITIILSTLIYFYLTDNIFINKTLINHNKEKEEQNKIYNSRDINIKNKDCLRFIKLRNTSPPKSINPKILNFEKVQDFKIEDINFNERRFRESLYEINKFKQERNYSENKSFFNQGKIIFIYFILFYFTLFYFILT